MEYLSNVTNSFKVSEEKLFQIVENIDENSVEQLSENHLGMSCKRLLRKSYFTGEIVRNNLEKEFVKQWIFNNNFHEVSSKKFYADTILDKHCDERELIIVNTVIQWLGTPCGISFIKSVLTKENYDKF